jgi:pimeloyl-ACP methyl ester carboxylesterase
VTWVLTVVSLMHSRSAISAFESPSAIRRKVSSSLAARHFGAGRHTSSILGDPGNRFLWAGGALTRAWPAAPGEDAYARLRDSDVPTLLISGTLDGATPADNATRELMPHLRNGRQVLLSGFGHTRAATSRAGLSAAVAGALIGAWLGFTCATAMLAAVTTLVGAIAGTNLALIGCDVASETRRRRRTAQPPASDVPRELVLHGGLR